VDGTIEKQKIKHLKHTHNGEQKKLNSLQTNFFYALRVYRFSYLWKREGGAAVFAAVLFFRKRCYGLLFCHACVHAAYGWREKTASGISMYCRLLGKYDAPLTNDDLIPQFDCRDVSFA
jgi:hypothetical protein